MIDTHLHLSHHLFDAQFSYLARNNEGSYTIQRRRVSRSVAFSRRHLT